MSVHSHVFGEMGFRWRSNPRQQEYDFLDTLSATYGTPVLDAAGEWQRAVAFDDVPCGWLDDFLSDVGDLAARHGIRGLYAALVVADEDDYGVNLVDIEDSEVSVRFRDARDATAPAVEAESPVTHVGSACGARGHEEITR